MTEKRKYLVLIAVTAAHFMLLALIIYINKPGYIEQPVAMQGILVSQQNKEQPVTEVTPPAKKTTPELSQPPVPVKQTPSERAITLPKEEPKPDTQSKVPEQVQPRKNEQKATPSISKTSQSSPDSSEPLVLPRVDAAHMINPNPVYPSLSRRMGEQGRVLLDVLILTNGTVGEIKLKKSSNYTRLDNAALDAVKRWRYQPARRGGKPIAFWYVQPIDFTLKN